MVEALKKMPNLRGRYVCNVLKLETLKASIGEDDNNYIFFGKLKDK